MRPRTRTLLLACAAALATVGPATADTFSGAIFTTDSTGTAVNQNIFTSLDAVYLNGGPQNQNSAGLPDGIYLFQVTDPSGSTLLSADNAINRELKVVNGVVAGVGPGGTHSIGTLNPANGSTPVQLFPFSVTPNPGGEYKAWLIQFEDSSGTPLTDNKGNPLAVIDPNHPTIIDFSPSASKTDNFKVQPTNGPPDGPPPGPNQAEVPEPTTLLLMGLGVAGVGASRLLKGRRPVRDRRETGGG